MNKATALKLYLLCSEYLKDYPQEDSQLTCALKHFCVSVEKQYDLPRKHLTRQERRQKAKD
jgi:hypothetical protein